MSEPDAQASGSASTTTAADERLRIVFSLLHAGYLRHYGDAIRTLAERGHSVRIVLQRQEKDAGDAALLDRLTRECPTITSSLAPERPWADGWRRLAWLVRALTDLARYADPRYANAVALKRRMAKKITLRVESSRMDRISKRFCISFVERLLSTSNAGLARKYIRRLARLEAAIPASGDVTRFLRQTRPHAVLASPVVEIASPQVEFVKAARQLRIPSGVCVASWDNLTNKGLIRVIPDRVFVWNAIQRDELEDMHGVSPERVVTTGAPKFDKWFGRAPSTSREEFLSTVHLNLSQPFVAYLCSSPFIAPDEVTFVRRWLSAMRASPQLKDVGIVVRPHPQNARQWDDADLSSFGNVTIWPRGGQQPDAGAASAAFFDTLYHSSAVVGLNTSALIEAAIAGSSVFTILDPAFGDTQEGTLHFHYLLAENGGFVHQANNLPEHTEQLVPALERLEGDRERTLSFVEAFCRPHGLTVAATTLLADGIEALARIRVPPAERLPLSILALRWLLYPVALMTSVAASGARLVRRRTTSDTAREVAATP